MSDSHYYIHIIQEDFLLPCIHLTIPKNQKFQHQLQGKKSTMITMIMMRFQNINSNDGENYETESQNWPMTSWWHWWVPRKPPSITSEYTTGERVSRVNKYHRWMSIIGDLILPSKMLVSCSPSYTPLLVPTPPPPAWKNKTDFWKNADQNTPLYIKKIIIISVWRGTNGAHQWRSHRWEVKPHRGNIQICSV